ncbi:MAG: hypothetical protein CMH57_01490 [Myxococcales bacterium]|nr:hypothetical protein [Myxococcales bacterium]
MTTTYRGLQLDPFQQQAIEAIDKGHSVLVAAPTGTGKTLIADYLVERIMAAGERIVYTAPIKALSNQKYREYVALHGEEKVGLVTGDVVIRRDAPLRIMTTEILRNILLQNPDAPGYTEIGEIGAVIFDELHFIDDPFRGTVWEEVLIYLPDDIQILGLSATLSNLKELAGWLSSIRSGTAGEVVTIRENKRAVPLHFFLANKELGLVPYNEFERAYTRWRKDRRKQRNTSSRSRRGRGRHRNRDDDSTRHYHIVSMLEERDRPALFFMFSRRGTERCARSVAKRNKQGMLNKQEGSLMGRLLREFDQEHPDVLQPHHRAMYSRGIAFHHAGLNILLKSLVERLYEQRLIKLLYCTSTFALGINMPARTVIFENLEKYNGEEIAPLTVRQFMQKAGRAGRRGIDDEGQVIVRMDFSEWTERNELLKRLMSDQSEPVTSSFNLSFHSVVNLLERFDQETIRDLIDRSFLAYQRAHHEQSLRDKIQLHEARLEMSKLAHIPGREEDDSGDSKSRKRLERLKRKLVRHQDFLWRQFQDKVTFLTEAGYIDADGQFGAGAKIIKNVQIEEVFLAELVLAGVFEDLTPAQIFGVCTGLVSELPRNAGVHAPLPAEIEEQLNTIIDILEGPILSNAVRLAGGEPRCDPGMMALGMLWANGASLQEVMDAIKSTTDISGDMVGAFRRGKELIKQLRLVYWDDAHRRAELRDLQQAITRDEVEALG